MTGNYNYNPSFTGRKYCSPYDIENLAKYATGVAISNQNPITASSLVDGAVGNLAVSGVYWLKDNRGNYKAALASSTQNARAMSNLYKSGGSFVKGAGLVANASSSSQLLGLMPSAEQLAGMSKHTQSLYNQAKIAAETLGQTGSSQAIKTANQLLCQANAAAAKEAATHATGFFGKIKNFFGINKAGAAINTAASKSSIGSACLNNFKAHGGTVMLVMEGATEAITNVYPTFKQLGAKAGMKQLGKSTVKTAASVGGWIAGSMLGAKVGAVIGSVIPVAGTAVGAAVGFAIGSICSLLGGTLGSKLAKKGAEKVVGKDELVIAQERQAKELANQAQKNGTVLNQVTAAAVERLSAEGVANEDARIAYNSLSAVGANPFN